MSCNNNEILHVGDYGTQFILTIKKLVDGVPTIVDISAVNELTDLFIYFRDSEGTITKHNAEFYTNGTDGRISYITDYGDIVTPGLLEYRAEVILSPTQKYQSSTCEIEVYYEWEVTP
jgi:hypothetical protein